MDEQKDVTTSGRVTTLGPFSFNLFTSSRLRPEDPRPPGPRPAAPSGSKGGRPRKPPTKAQSELLNKARSNERTHHRQQEQRKAKRAHQEEVEDGIGVAEDGGSGGMGSSSSRANGDSGRMTRSASKKPRVDGGH